MSVNEADLPTTGRSYGVAVSYPDSHAVRSNGSGSITYVTGPAGPAGPPGVWAAMTQAEYDAIVTKDPATLYVIIP